MIRPLLPILLMATPLAAQATDPLARLRALAPPAPAAAEIYAEDAAADRALIDAEASLLFDEGRARLGPPEGRVAIALFIGPDCPDCAAARADLATLADRLGVRAAVFDTADPEILALMRRLGLDLLPSYVLPDAMIRGQMPDFVLERDLTASSTSAAKR